MVYPSLRYNILYVCSCGIGDIPHRGMMAVNGHQRHSGPGVEFRIPTKLRVTELQISSVYNIKGTQCPILLLGAGLHCLEMV